MPPDNYMQSQPSVINLFLKLLHPEGSLTGIRIEKDQLAELWALSVKHNVAMLMYSRLRHFSAHLTPEAAVLLEGQRSGFLGGIARSIRQESEEYRLIDLLQQKGADACIIKGNNIARSIYGNPCSRSSSDIDILVRARDIVAVDKLLIMEGYDRYDNAPLPFWMERLHHAAYFSKTSGHTIEMHWCFGIPSFFDLTSDDIWKMTHRDGTGQIVLMPEMQVVQTLMHHHMHAFREMRSLVDLLWTFRTYADVIDWQQFTLRLKAIGLIKSTGITLNQLRELWGESCSSMRAVQDLEYACRSMGCPEPKMLIAYFRFDSSGSKQYYPLIDRLMARFALDRVAKVWFSLQKTILPSFRTILLLYGDDRIWMMPLHYLRFLAWRIKEWGSLSKSRTVHGSAKKA